MTAAEIVKQLKPLGAARTLAKPFKRNDMLGAVMELVGPPRP